MKKSVFFQSPKFTVYGLFNPALLEYIPGFILSGLSFLWEN